ncbi:hypothetical protein ZOSMA_66G00090 [Zostera marina]|uniref:Uncharacterized protein n=1 Tax=Zostera marina TaxID=29655 RepID=A0A0K9NS39_ZOSMR|nr:hypothetical protein ZOSMA_66G00090 [Zostera marina]
MRPNISFWLSLGHSTNRNPQSCSRLHDCVSDKKTVVRRSHKWIETVNRSKESLETYNSKGIDCTIYF